MNPKDYSFTYRWTQPYPQYNIQAELIKLRDDLLELALDSTDFEEANAVIAHIKSL